MAETTQNIPAHEPGVLPFHVAEGAGVESPVKPGMSDDDLLKLHKEWKKESFDHRWIWERNWMRNIHYTNNRMWITYANRDNAWRDVRLAKWVPKPVTPLIWEGVQALRAMFASVDIGANVRPIGSESKNIAVAAFCDELHPVLHEEHEMGEVMAEADYWFIVTGWACLHTYLERDIKYGTIQLTIEQCVGCEGVFTEDKIADAGQVCPECGGAEFIPSVDPETGESVKVLPKSRGVTVALSPFEVVFPNTYARFKDLPYVYRLRWRTKDYYESHPKLKAQTADIRWSKAPSEQSLQLFRSLPFHTDGGVAPFLGTNSGASPQDEGAVEYECWVRPCETYPKGLVFRVLGDSDPIILHLEEEEAIPGPLPYEDAEGNPLFTFEAAPFEQRGGRVYGSSPLDAGIPIMNQINQIDSMTQMIVQRMANPIWLVPKGAGIQKFSGEPGWIAEWNPLTVGGNAKPERLDGSSIPASVFQLRDQKVHDLEEALGTYDVLKGDRPPNVNAFSAMQLLVERAQSRFASSFKARGKMYQSWLKFALELERAFGEEERRHSFTSPAGSWVEKTFKNADLQGSFTVIVEDGSMTPKTTLGMRAAVEHIATLGGLDMTDPDQRYTVLQLFGQTKLIPTLNIHMQAALRKQQGFEEWALDKNAQQLSLMQAQQGMEQYQSELAAVQPEPARIDPATGMDTAAPTAVPPPPSPTKFTPLAWKVWYNARIHLQEFDKWANSDKIVELLNQQPALEPLLQAHREEIMMALQAELMAMAPPEAQKPGQGGAQAMKNSNSESGGSQNASDHTAKPQEGV